MNTLVYNIPVNLIPAYSGRKVIVRSHDSEELVAALYGDKLNDLVAVQLLSLSDDVDALADWGFGVPVDLVMLHPQVEFFTLYRFTKLLTKHPLRVCIPVVSGFSKAVVVAASLKFFIKLEIGQPDSSQIEELYQVLNFFLHSPSVSQPIEYFHSTFTSLYHDEPVSLWDIQEENPAHLRYITEDGREIVTRRLVCGGRTGDLDNFVTGLQNELFAQEAECCGCKYFAHCGGYFKWPNRNYHCNGVKILFNALEEAAREIQDNITSFQNRKGEPRDERQPLLSHPAPDQQM